MAKVSAKAVVQDIRAGVDDSALMQKYQISAQGLRILFRKLLDIKAITQAELSDRTPASDMTIALAWKCPACGTAQVSEMAECPDCGIIAAKFLEKRERENRPLDVAPYFRAKFNQFDANHGRFIPTWNWWAFLFPIPWYLVKGLYGKGLLIMVVWVIFLAVVNPQLGVVELIAELILMIYCGVSGNYDLYLKRDKKTQSPRFLSVECSPLLRWCLQLWLQRPITREDIESLSTKTGTEIEPNDLYLDAQRVIGDLKKIDFREEIVPITANNIALLKSDSVFLGMGLLGVTPLIITTVPDNDIKLGLFSAFFAVIWAVIFKKLILTDSSDWKIPIAAFFFTGLIGSPLMLLVYSILPSVYINLPSSENLIPSLLGYVFTVGVWEELCKASPVIIYLAWKAGKKEPPEAFEIVFIGVVSGLGFATFENMDYVNRVLQNSVRLTVRYGRAGFEYGVKGAMINPMLRNISLLFAHAVFSGICAYFLAVGATTGKRQAALFCVGLAVAAALHGLYDWTIQVNKILSIMTVCFSAMLFYAYLSKLRLPEHASVHGH